MGKLENRAALITGGGTGIGRAIALTFAREGADVAVCGRTPAALEQVSGEIKALGRKALAVTADVSVKAQVQNMLEQTLGELGKVDILVNNAGIGPRGGRVVDIPEEDWDAVMDVNLKGVFLCVQAAARHMMERGYGRIINIASIAAMRPPREGMSVYCVSKAGVEHLTKSAALELVRHGILVNAIAPGSIETPIYRKGRTQEQIDTWLASAVGAPIGRVGEPQEMANVALFLASEDASFICGETIVADGGRNIRMS